MARTALQIITLQGLVTVAYHQEGGEWIATALEFDLVGTGKTRDGAFNQLRELVSDYLLAYITSAGRTQFKNPADGQEWMVPDKERYKAVFVVTTKGKRRPRVINDIRDLRRCRTRLRELDLVPVEA